MAWIKRTQVLGPFPTYDVAVANAMVWETRDDVASTDVYIEGATAWVTVDFQEVEE